MFVICSKCLKNVQFSHTFFVPNNQDVRLHLWVRLSGFKNLSKLRLWSNFTVKIPYIFSMKKQCAPEGKDYYKRY